MRELENKMSRLGSEYIRTLCGLIRWYAELIVCVRAREWRIYHFSHNKLS